MSDKIQTEFGTPGGIAKARKEAKELKEKRRVERRDIAAMAMQGLIAMNPDDYDMGVEAVASDAVNYADALLKRLEETE